jgi:ParB/RepB/Spo0J family partition protein
MSRKGKGIVRPDFSRERDQKLDLSDMFAASMATRALAPDGQPGTSLEGARTLPLALIDHNPYQSRQVFDLDALQELADSISEHGVIEPVIVRPNEERYEIVAGERRYRAALLAGQESIPARIMELDATQAAIVTALENLQREDLDIEDEARQFAYLCEALDVSQRELARMLGKNHVYIARRIRLLKRPDLMEEYRSGRLVLLQAAALAGANEADEENEENEEDEGVSPRNTLAGSDAPGEPEDGEQDELELVEREDLPGFVVKRGASWEPAGGGRGGGGGKRGGKRPLFRWRPLQQFHNWVGRTHVTDIPEDERATVRAQLTEIKEALEKQLTELDRLQGGRLAQAEPSPDEQAEVAPETGDTAGPSQQDAS